MPQSIYDLDLDKNPANYQPLTPLGFLERAAFNRDDRATLGGRYHPTLQSVENPRGAYFTS